MNGKNYLLACSLLVLVSLSSVASAQTTIPGLIHLWSGEGNANDSVGGANGTLGKTTAFGPGLKGQAFSFDGGQTSVIDRLPVNINPSTLPQMTMGMWVNLRTEANNRGWVIGHDNGGYDRSLNLTDSRYGYGVAGGTGTDPHSSSLIKLKDNLNTWHCVAVAYDASAQSATFYADGSTQTVSAYPGSGETNATLGGLRNFSYHTVDGLVDEVFMFNRVLTTADIDSVCRDLSTVAVAIDIKPGSFPNSVNINGNGVIPVAILGSSVFDVTQIAPLSLLFNGSAVRVRGKQGPQCSVQDVSGDFTTTLEGAPDGYPDLVCQFVDDPTQWTEGVAEGSVNGSLYNGTPFTGTDSINIVKCTDCP